MGSYLTGLKHEHTLRLMKAQLHVNNACEPEQGVLKRMIKFELIIDPPNLMKDLATLGRNAHLL